MNPGPRSDAAYLRRQYADSGNLDARFQLHDRFSVNRHGWHEWVFDHLDLPAEARLLELGCGGAYLWQKNAARVPPGWHLTLTDRSPGMLADARRNLQALGLPGPLPWRFACGDAQHLPWPAAHFDAVVANHMLYHVPDRPRALTEVRRVLRPGGCLLAATNGAAHLRELHQLVRQVCPDSPVAATLSRDFTLQNGPAQLRPHFAQVELHRYEDHLAVTDPEAVVAFVRSMRPPTEAQDQHLRQALERLFAPTGAFTIAKESGLFLART